MSELWAVLMLLAGGLFAGGSATFAWSRVPIWRRLALADFARDFEATLRWTDRVQPALLVLAIGSGAAFAVSVQDEARLLGALGTAALALVLILSLAILVPLQRTIIAIAADPAASARVEAMRRRWFTGNRGRSLVAVTGYVLLVVAAVV